MPAGSLKILSPNANASTAALAHAEESPLHSPEGFSCPRALPSTSTRSARRDPPSRAWGITNPRCRCAPMSAPASMLTPVPRRAP
eukprot:5660672-Prymnesium_polylepis.1